ncbi:MAG: signal peptidase I [Thermoleophilia bacterium]
MAETDPSRETPKDNSKDGLNMDRQEQLTPQIRHNRWVSAPPAGWTDGSRAQEDGLNAAAEAEEAALLDTGSRIAALPAKPRRRIFSFRAIIRDIVAPLIIAFTVAMFAQATLAKPYQIPSGSMLPTIQLQDRILTNRMIYRLHSVQRGDVIVFTPPMGVDQGTPYVKRVIGLPGEVVDIHGGKTYVNGEEYVVPSAITPTYARPAETVPDGMLFVLGDNRNESSDSHIWGYVPVENVIGRADIVYWPPKDFHLLGN